MLSTAAESGQISGDGRSVGFHQLHHEVEVMNGCQSERCDLSGFKQVIQITDFEVLAGVATAMRVNRSESIGILAFGKI